MNYFRNRRSVEESLQQFRNEKNRYLNQTSTPIKIISNEMYDPNQNKYQNYNGNIITAQLSSSVTNINHATNNSQPQASSYHHHQLQHDRYSMGNANLNGVNNKNSCNGNSNGLSSAVLHPALLNIINEAQGMKFRGEFRFIQWNILFILRCSKICIQIHRSLIFGYSTKDETCSSTIQ